MNNEPTRVVRANGLADLRDADAGGSATGQGAVGAGSYGERDGDNTATPAYSQPDGPPVRVTVIAVLVMVAIAAALPLLAFSHFVAQMG